MCAEIWVARKSRQRSWLHKLHNETGGVKIARKIGSNESQISGDFVLARSDQRPKSVFSLIRSGSDLGPRGG